MPVLNNLAYPNMAAPERRLSVSVTGKEASRGKCSTCTEAGLTTSRRSCCWIPRLLEFMFLVAVGSSLLLLTGTTSAAAQVSMLDKSPAAWESSTGVFPGNRNAAKPVDGSQSSLQFPIGESEDVMTQGLDEQNRLGGNYEEEEDTLNMSSEDEQAVSDHVRLLLIGLSPTDRRDGSIDNQNQSDPDHHPANDATYKKRVDGFSSDGKLPNLLEFQCTSPYGPRLQLYELEQLNLQQPTLVQAPILIHEHPLTIPYRALVLIGFKRRHHSSVVARLCVHVFEVEQNNGQTWRLHDQINVTFLPPQCRDPHQLLPMVAPSMNREKVFIYGFGVKQACSKLPVVVYDPSKRSHLLVRISYHNFHIPTTFSAMTAIDTGAKIKESLVVFGGTHCQSDEVTEMSCRTFSNDIFVLEFDAEDYESGRWDVIRSDNTTVDAYVATPTARISSAVFTDNYSALLVYGGVSLSEGSNGAISLTSECDVWSFDFRNRDWKKMNDLKQDCISRSSESCFSPNQVPMRPLAGFSTGHRQLIVASFAFSKASHSCVGHRFSVSHLNLDDISRNWGTLNQTETMLFTSRLIDNSRKLRSLSLVLHDGALYMGRSVDVAVWNISVTYNYDRKEPSVAWNPLPRTERMFRFPGNLGCTAPSPLLIDPQHLDRNDTSLIPRYSLVIGGFCVLSEDIGHGGSYLEAMWNVMPIWTSPLQPGSYTMRLVHPGPPFSHRLFHTTVLLEHGGVRKAVLYGGVSMIAEKIKPDVWCFDVSAQYWQKANLTSHQDVPQWGDGNAIAGHVAFAVTNTSFAIYGGLTYTYNQSVVPSALNDTFVFRFSNLSACQGSWTDLSPSVVGKPLPHRFLHTLALWNDHIYIAGGMNSALFVPVFKILSLTISLGNRPQIRHKTLAMSSHIPPLLGFTLIGYTSDMLLLLGGIQLKCLDRAKRRECMSETSYLISVGSHNATGLGTAIPFFSNYPIILHNAVDRVIYGGLLVPFPISYHDRVQSKTYGAMNCFYRLERGYCPLGYASHKGTCRKCDMGYYSDSLSGGCQPCASFTVTNTTGSSRCFAPNPCYENFCNSNGRCFVDGAYIARCNCKWGYFSYDRCRFPLAFVMMAVSVLISFAIALFIAHKVRSSRKTSKQRERELMVSKQQLRQLADGVIIKWDELQQSIVRQIGAGSSGDVYLAELSDMNVAVKVLRHCRVNDISFLEKFIKEIELMRTVRHPNIVMFLGAGTQPTQHNVIPFIVMEYVARGSLSNVLQVNPAEISGERRVSFALDIARGMEFLHNSTTPRIHRDLKSSNMLVTSKWNVKIADFGMLRLLSTLQDFDTSNPEDNLVANCTVYRRCQYVGCREPPPARVAGEATPLLPTTGRLTYRDVSMESSMTRMMGSSRWCSPETLKDGVFNQRTDVYSYGVVLWEILTHQLPYNDLADEDVVIAEIIRGERLSFPTSLDGCTYMYKLKRLIETCWSEAAADRPLFGDILDSLSRSK